MYIYGVHSTEAIMNQEQKTIRVMGTAGEYATKHDCGHSGHKVLFHTHFN